METPDVTRAQVVALAVALANVIAAATGMSASTTDAVRAFLVVAITVVLADAHVRNGRSRIAAAAQTAESVDEEPLIDD